MSSTYSVTEAQSGFPALLKEAEDNLVLVTRRAKPVAYIVSAERMAAIAETLEIMADPTRDAGNAKSPGREGQIPPSLRA
ncbi:MAG: type II toxin-antitoxin system Phd/YefM family antitoxin [Chthoniobacterales bacterium]|nr:type II toxin-antitoxin system Phd/YefM family antitoxin [Chthoniobacterales bacterium]